MPNMDDDKHLTPQQRTLKDYQRSEILLGKEREDKDDAYQDMIALSINPRARVNGKGKRISANRDHHEKKDCTEKSVLAGLDFGVITLSNLKSIFQNMNYMASFMNANIGQATATAPAMVPQRIADIHSFEDAERIYNTRMVSALTARKLYEESQIIAARVEELEATHDPVLHRTRAQALVELVDEYEMVQHPRTGMYIHSVIRVDKLEEANNAAGNNCVAEVCVFHLKADIASSRGIKRSISDVYNDNPEEVELTQAELAAQEARAIPPPNLQII